MSTQYSMFRSIHRAARYLERFPKGRRRSSALETLANAFYDVELPQEPLELSDDERKALSKEASGSIAKEFKVAAKTAKRASLTPLEFRRLASSTDPLWRVLAAANWDVVRAFETERIGMARGAVMAMVTSIVSEARSAGAEDIDAEEVLSKVYLEMEAPDSMLVRQLEPNLAAMGLGVAHFRYAVKELLSEQ